VGPDAVSVLVSRTPRGPAPPEPAEDARLRVAATTKAAAIAGAVAAKARSGCAHLSITGIGPIAVLKMVKALSLCEFPAMAFVVRRALSQLQCCYALRTCLWASTAARLAETFACELALRPADMSRPLPPLSNAQTMHAHHTRYGDSYSFV
jgi:stage V sporulation protein SpoVS